MNTQITTTPETLPIPADRMAALRQKATTPIRVSQSVVSDSLIGIIVGTRQALSAYSKSSQVLVKDKAGNVTAVWLTSGSTNL